MKTMIPTGRQFLALAAAALLAGCQAVPKAPASQASRPADNFGSASTNLPSDNKRHRVALLVPMSGEHGATGKAIANAATMALLDANADNLRITTYDTAPNARQAALSALAEGNRLILGPLLPANVPSVIAETRRAGVPLISYTNDRRVARPDAFVMGLAPEQSIERSIRYASGKNANMLAGLFPLGDYGTRDQVALREAAARSGSKIIKTERYSSTPTSLSAAAHRLRQNGGYNAAIVADGAAMAERAAGILKQSREGPVQIIGTELWSGDPAVANSTSLRGAWFSALSDTNFRRFANSYKNRFGEQPPRIATLGYDSVLLTLRVAQDWRVGQPFPTKIMYDPGGFLGLDGAFRFLPVGAVERALEVREVRSGKIVIIDPAPQSFGP